jgi:hypothetical protein
LFFLSDPPKVKNVVKLSIWIKAWISRVNLHHSVSCLFSPHFAVVDKARCWRLRGSCIVWS